MIFSEFDDVILLTQDTQNFTSSLSKIIHVPCAFSKSKRMRSVLSRFMYFRWLYVFFYSFLWLVKHRRAIDLMISENIDSPVFLIFSKLFRLPYVIYYRYDVASQVKSINKRLITGTLLSVLESFAFKRVRKLWVTSPHLAQMAESLGRKDETTVIPNWVESTEIEDDNDTIFRDRSIGPRILFVGRLHRVKQVDLLLQAFYIIHKNNPDTHLYIVGDGDERQKIIGLTNSLKLSDNVHFLGFLHRRTVLTMMKKSDVFVLPSKIEGNPRVLVEAMMCKIPIVATNVPGIRDMVNHVETGFLVDRADPKELAHAIEHVLKNKELSTSMVDSAYVFAKHNFSKERIMQVFHEEMASVVPKYGLTM